MRRFARTKLVVLLTGVVMSVLGVAVLVNPMGAVELLVRVIGWVLVIYGAITLVSAFVKGDPVHNAPAELGMGIIALIPGLVLALFPGAVTSFVWTFIGIIVLVTGLMDIMEAGELRRVRSVLATPATASGVITALLGLGTIIAPMAVPTAAMVLAGIALLVDGVTEIVVGLGM